MPDFEAQLVEHRLYLLRFARLQLRNDEWAEDAVSETLLAALSKPQSFGNRSQLKTWLVGILKATMGLRLSQEEEFEGADLSIHRIGATPDREVNW